jgi:hypothetical protein
MAWLFAASLAVGVLRRRGLGARLQALVGAVWWSALGGVLTAVVVLLHALQAFSGETRIAHVTTQPAGREAFDLTYRPVGAPAAAAQTVRLQGDQWTVSGGIVKWAPWLGVVGLKTYHKPLRISGQFSRLERQRAQPPTVFALTPDTDPVWEAFYRAAPYLPFVDAVYGSSAYVYAQSDVVYDVYVTPSGYLIRRAK